ncbi:GMC family oxidoreductase N-terminal domain-containing protein [Ensifer psoraleae]|uniref:GMC family oxidoreductase N-terminal domain-containing protein n=1 Tax=Sinorhizobium psoraleae TaxID=520838 RepID=A0ABT4KNT6_9HYPH|nr:GMC family oxidoreductase N-terminal domain-containing protein [Sinorhizobium psoraleae]MCZ4093650.1 GMC family oxidoreductase N-terminal domain-containing protein [Sinorhizobium psoraleae]
MAQRADSDLLDQWRKLYKIENFTPDELAQYYQRAETTVNASLTPGPLGRPTDILRRGGEALGWKVTQLQRGQRGCKGANRCSLVCPNGAKQSMATTLLPKAMDRGMRLLALTRVDKIGIDKGRATVVYARSRYPGGQAVHVRVKAGLVFVCAGAIPHPRFYAVQACVNALAIRCAFIRRSGQRPCLMNLLMPTSRAFR